VGRRVDHQRADCLADIAAAGTTNQPAGGTTLAIIQSSCRVKDGPRRRRQPSVQDDGGGV